MRHERARTLNGAAQRWLPLLLLTSAWGCGGGGPLAGLLPDPATPHERYADALRQAGLDSTALGRDWLMAADSALHRPLPTVLPSEEVGVYHREDAIAIAHRVDLREGQRLRVSLVTEGLPARLFVDLYEVTGDSARPFEHVTHATFDSTAAGLVLNHEAERAGGYIVRFQPELLRDGRYTLTMRSEPALAFPVEGHGNRAIRSRFGVARDGGVRTHAGIDIFAPRGTPVLAAAQGVVRSLRPNRLGGNVVWLHDEQRRQSLYYAHLDRQAVREGQRVSVGDTIGFVGNTGNAITTPPHLHFGIYRAPDGAIDPFPWVAYTDSVPDRITADTARLGQLVVARTSRLALQPGPNANAPPARLLRRDEALEVMAATAHWYRVQLEDGASGYLMARSVRSRDE
jgi:murein DD-endopeptidase MepM/ murein hydrolase activator NlpD